MLKVYLVRLLLFSNFLTIIVFGAECPSDSLTQIPNEIIANKFPFTEVGLQIFRHLRIPCEGNLTYWNIRVSSTNSSTITNDDARLQVHLAVFRQLSDNITTAFFQVGETFIDRPITNTSFDQWMLLEAEVPIKVQQGDVLGIYYESFSSELRIPSEKLFGQQDSANFPSTLTKLIDGPTLIANQFDLGLDMSLAGSDYRIPAVVAWINFKPVAAVPQAPPETTQAARRTPKTTTVETTAYYELDMTTESEVLTFPMTTLTTRVPRTVAVTTRNAPVLMPSSWFLIDGVTEVQRQIQQFLTQPTSGYVPLSFDPYVLPVAFPTTASPNARTQNSRCLQQPSAPSLCFLGSFRYIYDFFSTTCKRVWACRSVDNANNFGSLEECNELCVKNAATARQPRYINADCNQTPSISLDCPNPVTKYYFNNYQNKCLSILACDKYGFQANVFATIEECSSRCNV